MSKIAFSQNLAKLKSYATRGDEEAAVISAMLDNIKVLELSNDAEGDTAANTFRISVQVQDMDGSPIAGTTRVRASALADSAITMAAGGVGTAVIGDGTAEAVFETDANGALEIDVTDAAAEPANIQLTLDDGTVEQVDLTFA